MANPEFDALMAQALALADADKRRELMVQMCTILQQEGYIINPFSRSLFSHHKEGFAGLGHHPAFEHHHYKWSVA
jgi:peptide/nickel transport system substrate-binding protein